ncbi:hypothetical protein [Aquimarina longa]|uniref:hypothetical protein n=1 Tax=Aquimarina longa TaxID=1080221 RepID=UPI0007854964|nr:hypothetical protein [Aquimarina longa]
MKKILNLEGIQKLTKDQQKKITGSFYYFSGCCSNSGGKKCRIQYPFSLPYCVSGTCSSDHPLASCTPSR